MKLNSCLLLCLFSFWSVFSKAGTNSYEQLKIAVDAMSVNNALWVLTSSGENPKIKVYEDKLNQLLDDLSNQNTGFRKDSYPVELNIDSGNKSKVEEICEALKQTVQEIRDLAIMASGQFEAGKLEVLMILSSENPGDYYSGINPDFQFDLHNHPLRDKIESLELQDIGFVEIMASGDTSLWNMAIHCPNLKRLTMFGAEVDSDALNRLNLNRVKQLEVAELSENYITALPEDFNANNTLLVLNLRRNSLTRLPANLASWTNLKFLDLRNNELSSEEQQRIKNSLPTTKILF